LDGTYDLAWVKQANKVMNEKLYRKYLADKARQQ